MIKKKYTSINLQQGGKKKSIETFIDWALTIGRIIIIITETVALGAFLYRFVLDRELVDLHESIEKKQAIVNLAKKNEAEFRNLADRLKLSAVLMEKAEGKLTLIRDLLALPSPDTTVNNIVFSEDKVSIISSVPSVDSLKTLIEELRQYPQVTTVSIDRIENKTSSATIALSITATLKNVSSGVTITQKEEQPNGKL